MGKTNPNNKVAYWCSAIWTASRGVSSPGCRSVESPPGLDAEPLHHHMWPKNTVLTVLTLTSWSQGSAGPQGGPVIILHFPHSPALLTRLVTMLHNNWINRSRWNRPRPHARHPPSARIHAPCPSSWQCDPEVGSFANFTAARQPWGLVLLTDLGFSTTSLLTARSKYDFIPLSLKNGFVVLSLLPHFSLPLLHCLLTFSSQAGAAIIPPKLLYSRSAVTSMC